MLPLNSSETLLDNLRQRVIEKYKKDGDKIVLLSPSINKKNSWTGNELANEVENKTDFGNSLVTNLIELTLDLVARDKLTLKE